MYNKNWTKEEENYLEEKWGIVSVPSLAKKLNRTENAIVVRAQRLGLGQFLMGGEYVTFNQLTRAFNDTSASYKLTSWVKNRGFPVHTKRVRNNSFRVVYLHEFWKWAEENRSFLDFSKLEPYSLGEEPSWVPEQRAKDFEAFRLQRKDPWTVLEDDKLRYLLSQHKYGYAELSDILRRSAGAIQRRISDLKLKDRPVKADNHGASAAWSEQDFTILADGIRNGDSYTLIGKKIGKSEKAVRGKVYFVYLTENADKVRKMLGDHEWGYGAPEPTVKQAVHLSRTRTETKAALTDLVTVLRTRMNDLGYDPYWQRFMCQNWDSVQGCSAGCTECDTCTEFVRIKPQYCARCGGTFYERKENRFCEACRTARKKQAQRKWCRMNNPAGR